MSDSAYRRHGLESFLEGLPGQTAVDGTSVQVCADLGHINLRGNPGNPEFLAAIAAVLNQPLPLVANTSTTGNHRVHWLGPDEWQLVTSAAGVGDLVSLCREAVANFHASVQDQSGGFVVLHLRGPDARDLLAKGCTLDLSPGKFKAGCCAQGGLGKAGMLIACLGDDEPHFEIIVRRSFADYAARWLRHAGRSSAWSFVSTVATGLK